MGLVAAARAASTLAGEDVDEARRRTAIVRRGVGYVPEDRDIFAGLTVEENLRLAERNGTPRYDLVYDLFPELPRARRASAPGRSRAASSRWSRSPARS